MRDTGSPHANRENAEAAWRCADALVARAASLEEEARECRAEAERLNRIAAAWADGRRPENEL